MVLIHFQMRVRGRYQQQKKWFFRKHVFAILQLGCFDRDVILLRGVFLNETAQLPSAETYLY